MNGRNSMMKARQYAPFEYDNLVEQEEGETQTTDSQQNACFARRPRHAGKTSITLITKALHLTSNSPDSASRLCWLQVLSEESGIGAYMTERTVRHSCHHPCMARDRCPNRRVRSG